MFPWRHTSSSILMGPTIRCAGTRTGGSSTAITTVTAICRATSFAAIICWQASRGAASVAAADGAVEEVAGWNYSSNPASPCATPKLVRKTSTIRFANPRFWLRRSSIDIVPTIGTALSTRELEPHPAVSRCRSASERSRTCDKGLSSLAKV
jgi:hypothetical protein